MRTILLVATAIGLVSSGRAAAQIGTESVTVVPVSNTPQAAADLSIVQAGMRSGPLIAAEPHPPGGVQILGVTGGAKPAEAVSIATTAINKIESTLDGLSANTKRSRDSVLQQLQSGFKQLPLPAFTIAGSGSASSVEALSPNKGFAAALARAPLFGVRVDPGRLLELPNSGVMQQFARSHPALEAFSRQYDHFVGALFNSLNNPAPASRDSLRHEAVVTREEFIENWRGLRDDPQARALAVRSLGAIQNQPNLKAVYAVETRYQPISYRNIYDVAARLAIVSDSYNALVCSGLEIGNGWVLTARHCLNQDLGDLRLRLIDGAGQMAQPRTIMRLWPASGEEALDYVFLQTTDPNPVSKTGLCFRQMDAGYEEPLIAIGYAQDKELVYDAAYVWYPYSALPKAYNRVAAMTMLRLQRLAEAWPGSQSEQEALFQREMKSFEAAYSKTSGSGDSLIRYYTIAPKAGIVARPRFGFDTDTSHGDSGAAVFSRKDNCVVGVFSGGRPDTSRLAEANWMEHEFGTPISAILADIDAKRASGSGSLDASEQAALTGLFALIDKARR